MGTHSPELQGIERPCVRLWKSLYQHPESSDKDSPSASSDDAEEEERMTITGTNGSNKR